MFCTDFLYNFPAASFFWILSAKTKTFSPIFKCSLNFILFAFYFFLSYLLSLSWSNFLSFIFSFQGKIIFYFNFLFLFLDLNNFKSHYLLPRTSVIFSVTTSSFIFAVPNISASINFFRVKIEFTPHQFTNIVSVNLTFSIFHSIFLDVLAFYLLF